MTSRLENHDGAQENLHDRMESMSKKFTVGLVQMKCTTNKEENMTRAEERSVRRRSAGRRSSACMNCLRGNIFAGRKMRNCSIWRRRFRGRRRNDWRTVAKEKKVALVVSLFERRAAGVYHNACAILDADGTYLGKYRKMHIPDDPLYYEKFYFTPGDLGFLNFDTKYARIGVQICWDQWYPEGSRLTAMQGARGDFLSDQYWMASA